VRTKNSPLDGDEGVIRSFIRHRTDLSPQTRIWYGALLRRYAAWLRLSGLPVTVASVNMATAEQYIEMRGERVKANSLRCEAIVLRTFGNYIGAQIIKGTSPVAGVRIPQADDSPRRALTNAELNRLLAASKRGPNGKLRHAIVRVAAGCGLRLGELCGIRLEDVLFDDSELVVNGATSKSKRLRKVTLHDEVIAGLDDYLRHERVGPDQGSAPLFLNRLGRGFRTSGMASLFRDLAVSSEIPDLSAHMLRHTWATFFVRAGTGDFTQLTREAGWRDKQARMAFKYVHEKPIAERRRAPSPFSVLARAS
jgi:integrase